MHINNKHKKIKQYQAQQLSVTAVGYTRTNKLSQYCSIPEAPLPGNYPPGNQLAPRFAHLSVSTCKQSIA